MTTGVTFRLIIIMVLWAACFPFITLGLSQSPHIAFAALRALLAGASLVILIIFLRRPWPKETRTWVLITITGLGSTTLGFLGMFHAAEFVTPGLATVIASIQPLIAAILSRIILSESLGFVGYTGLIMGFFGIAVISSPNTVAAGLDNSLLGVGYLLLAAAGVAIGNISIKKLTDDIDGLVAMGCQFLIGAIPLAVAALLLEDVTTITWSGQFVISLVVLALPGSALAFWLWYDSLGKVPLGRANAFTFLVPLFGLTIGLVWFGEQLGWSEVVGIVLILAGIALVKCMSSKHTG